MPRDNQREKGKAAEDMARAYLIEQGFQIVRSNFQFGKVGEIDLVCTEHQTLVFVEVKARRSLEFGRPEDAIHKRKQQQIRRVAQAYLYINGLLDVECRFDVVAIDESVVPPEIRHYRNAFW